MMFKFSSVLAKMTGLAGAIALTGFALAGTEAAELQGMPVAEWSLAGQPNCDYVQDVVQVAQVPYVKCASAKAPHASVFFRFFDGSLVTNALPKEGVEVPSVRDMGTQGLQVSAVPVESPRCYTELDHSLEINGTHRVLLYRPTKGIRRFDVPSVCGSPTDEFMATFETVSAKFLPLADGTFLLYDVRHSNVVQLRSDFTSSSALWNQHYVLLTSEQTEKFEAARERAKFESEPYTVLYQQIKTIIKK